MAFATPVELEFLDGSFYDQSATAYYLSPDKLAADFSPVRYAREIRFFHRFCVKGWVLDVGCSTGGFLHQLAKTFPNTYECFGTDASAGVLQYAEQHGIRTIQRSFLETDFFEPEQFDAVTFWAVLEHVADPGAFLTQAKRFLKPGGFCFVLVPNFRSLAVRLLERKYRYILPQHINYFTKTTVEQLAARHFTVVKVTTSHFNPIVILQDFRSKDGVAHDEERARLLARTNSWKESKRLGPIKFIYRFSEGVLSGFGLADNLIAVLQKTG
jgi:SAM-dependent methyltransferase